MLSRTQIAMLFLLVGAAMFYYFYDVKGAPEREKAEVEAKRLFPALKKDDLVGLIVEKLKEPKSKQALVQTDGKWMLEGPPAQLVSTSEVLPHIKAVMDLQQKKELTATPSAESLKEFGLDAPSYRITLRSKDGQTHTMTMGNKTPSDAGYYVETAEKGPVYSVQGDFGPLLESSAAKLRDASPLPVEPSKANRLKITGADGKVLEAKLKEARDKPTEEPPDDVTITNLSEEWDLVSPESAVGDGGKIRDLMWAWKNLKAGRFLKPDEKVDFARPTLKLEVWSDGQDKPQVLEVGPVVGVKKNMYYARRLDPPEAMVLEFPDPKILTPQPQQLRNRHLANFEVDQVERVDATVGNLSLAGKKYGDAWRLQKPTALNPDEGARNQAVTDLLWELKNGEWAEDTATKRELKPRATLSLFGKDDKPLGKIVVGEATGKGAFVQIGDDQTVYKLAEDPLVKWEAIVRRASDDPGSTPTPGESPTP